MNANWRETWNAEGRTPRKPGGNAAFGLVTATAGTDRDSKNEHKPSRILRAERDKGTDSQSSARPLAAF
jgi:hypothetical protein